MRAAARQTTRTRTRLPSISILLQRIVLLVLSTSMAAATELSIASTTKLRSGIEMPRFGLGTWLADSDECRAAVKAALEHGYVLIDTATMYKNEADIGSVLKEAAQRPFLVSKLRPEDHGSEETVFAALERTLSDLGIDQLDVWLMHTPAGGKVVETWRAMLKARDAGKVRSVGVSNFGVAQLQALIAAGCEAPEINQIELHVWNQQRDTVAFCQREHITVMAFCPYAEPCWTPPRARPFSWSHTP